MKHEITSSRPVASQLVSCDAALERATSKLREHEAEIVRLTKEAGAARERVEELKLERSRLQATMAARPSQK